jgi:TonB family protein
MSVALSPAPDETKPAPRVQPELPLQQAAEQQPALAAPARWISGGLEDSDNRKGRFAGAVAVRITVGPDGRAGGCRIAQSSGNPALDQTTCRLLGERLRFSPARDATGRSVTSEVGTTYVWGRRLRR